MKMPKPAFIFVAVALLTTGLAACSSGPEVKSQAYAELPNQRTFEYDFPTVWKGIESALKNQKITDRDPSDIDTLEMKKLTKRTLETDWIYGRSDSKYQEYSINGTPRKQYLQTRFRYKIVAASVMGGTDVKVKIDEEIEKLKKDGTSDGYDEVEKPDPNRAGGVLDKINQAILAAPPISSN